MTGSDRRPWVCALDPNTLSNIQRGVMQTRYRGRLFLKSPFDVILYLQLIQRLQPRTVIEIGTKEGGSALWFADTLCVHGISGMVYSIDINAPPPLEDDRIRFLQGDARQLGHVLASDFVESLSHPFLIIEDSRHFYDTTLAVLQFFHEFLKSGDYLVVEDGVVQFLPEDRYRAYDNGPNRAVETFLTAHADEYIVDSSLCDYYGCNVTYNPNGYLRRV